MRSCRSVPWVGALPAVPTPRGMLQQLGSLGVMEVRPAAKGCTELLVPTSAASLGRGHQHAAMGCPPLPSNQIHPKPYKPTARKALAALRLQDLSVQTEHWGCWSLKHPTAPIPVLTMMPVSRQTPFPQ